MGGTGDGGGRGALTFGTDQAAVVSNRTAVLKDEDRDGHHGETHDKHHHPDRRAVRLYGGGDEDRGQRKKETGGI